jgi:hypothetical protein
MFKKLFVNLDTHRGFTLLYALVVVGLLLSVGSSIFGIMIKELKLAQFGQESQVAYYAAESGIECALFWGLTEGIFPSGGAFTCNYDSSFPTENSWSTTDPLVCSGPLCIFQVNYRAGSSGVHYPCAYVTVDTSGSNTVVQSRGYNTCAPDFPRRVERGVEATF